MNKKFLLKKLGIVSVAMLLICGVTACGDSKKDDDTAIDITTASITEAPVVTTEEPTTEATTTEEPRIFTIEDVNARNEETEEWTEENWIEYATDMYQRAYEATWAYLENPDYKINYNEFVSKGERNFYQSVYQDTIKEAAAEYYNVFAHSEASEAAFNDRMIEKDGHVYIDVESRDRDKYYIDSEILAVDTYYTNQIDFIVQCNYYDPDYYDSDEEKIIKQERIFSLKYEGGKWKAYEFTLPN